MFPCRSRDLAFHSGLTTSNGTNPHVLRTCSWFIHSFIRNTTCSSDVSSWRWDERKKHGSVHRSSVSCCQHPPDDSHSRQESAKWCWRERTHFHLSIRSPPSSLMSARVGPIGQRLSRRFAIAIGQHQRVYIERTSEGCASTEAAYPLLLRRERDGVIKRDRNARGRRGESGR